MTEIDKVIAEARTFLGCKWRHKGRNHYGIDCAGLVVCAYKAAGIEVYDAKHYGREPWMDKLDEHLEKTFGKRLNKDEMQEGDVAVIWWNEVPAPSHLGIIAKHPNGGLSLIHSYSQHNVVEHRIDEDWFNKISHIYRMRKWEQPQS